MKNHCIIVRPMAIRILTVTYIPSLPPIWLKLPPCIQ